MGRAVLLSVLLAGLEPTGRWLQASHCRRWNEEIRDFAGEEGGAEERETEKAGEGKRGMVLLSLLTPLPVSDKRDSNRQRPCGAEDDEAIDGAEEEEEKTGDGEPVWTEDEDEKEDDEDDKEETEHRREEEGGR
ncbi:UNVERIFIED_CONTAM: hypothetical protein HHA_262590 [Hammondia hammondi]|eukprot:XP_008882858.1 hypothetical protein HHA_262590 [Hammondia hammondi]